MATTTTIAVRIYDFLKEFPPFQSFKKTDLLFLCEQVVVRYVELRDTVFKEGDEAKPDFFVVREGAIRLTRMDTQGAGAQLYNLCDEGDIFGIRQLFGDDSYALTAMAAEDSLIYCIPIEAMKTMLEEYPKVIVFLANAYALNIRRDVHQTLQVSQNNGGNQNSPLQNEIYVSSIFTLDRVRKAVTCHAQSTLKAAAALMTERNVSSLVVVNEAQMPIGIFSDSTLRKVVARTHFDPKQSVEAVMTKPPACTKAGQTLADIQISMIRNKVRYLCITEDGTGQTPLIGIVSEHDLIIAHGRNPAVLIREINYANAAELVKIMERADDLLKSYVQREVAIPFVANILAEIHDALNIRAIQLVQHDMLLEGKDVPNVAFAWLLIGSAGRREQLLRTDQDSALLFADVPTEQYAATQAYFIELAQRVTHILNDCGFAYCKGDMMASNPQYCLSLGEWSAKFQQWVKHTNAESLLNCKIFFDFRPVFGNMNLFETLQTEVRSYFDKESIFLTMLARDSTLTAPPLSFFRNLIVERNGEHRNHLNIKNRALVLIADAVRTLALGARVAAVGTLDRLAQLADNDAPNAELFQDCATAYENLMRFRAINGLRTHSTGRYINPEALSKLDRLVLRQSFMPIEKLQDLVKLRFGVNAL